MQVRLHHGHHVTRTTGFEPATSRATSERSTTELRPRELRGQESNLLSRAHEAREMPFLHRASFMWPAGFEPATPRASSGRSTGLSYSHVELLSRFSVPLSHPSALDRRRGRRPTWRGVGARCRRDLRRGLSLSGGASVSQWSSSSWASPTNCFQFKVVLERKRAAIRPPSFLWFRCARTS